MTELIVTDYFRREAKPLAKKYRSLAKEIAELFESLKKEPILCLWVAIKSALPLNQKEKVKEVVQE